MDNEKLSYQSNVPQVDSTSAMTPPLPIVNVHVAESTDKLKRRNIWGILSVLGVFSCLFLLQQLLSATVYHHAVLDKGLRQLEEEVHVMMEMQRVNANVIAPNVVNDAPAVEHHEHHDHHYSSNNHRVLPHERKHHGGSGRYAKNRLAQRDLAKRQGGSVLTWFHPGEGACGGFNGDNDFIVAISHDIWDGGSHCGDTISISYNGKSAKATVVDECMGCQPNHIDLSPGLLHYLAGGGTDMVTTANWMFGSFSPPKPKPTPTPTPTHTYKPTPTPKPSTSSTSKSSSSSSSSSSLSTVSSSSAAPSATPYQYADGQTHNILDIEVLLVSLGQMVLSGASA